MLENLLELNNIYDLDWSKLDILLFKISENIYFKLKYAHN